MTDAAANVAWIDTLDVNDIGRAGPKIAKLGELRATGMTVPRGFVVTAGAYEQAMIDPELGRTIDELLSQVDPDDHSGVREITAQVRSRVAALELSQQLANEISDAYAQLCEQCGVPDLMTAVRSSATGEDAADASFAGQFDTYLGVHGIGDLLDAVRACWVSLFTERAVIYRAMNSVSHHDCPMAVGVLELIDARASGVAFSVHPVTGRRDRIVIEGSWGWGEAVVQGLVTPDRAEVGKSDARILDYVVSNKLVMSAFDPEHRRVVERAMPEELQSTKVLTDIEVVEIAAAVKQIETHFDHPVDVEWVTSTAPDGEARVTIVQARPETVHGPAGPDAPPEWNPAGYAMRYAFGDPTP